VELSDVDTGSQVDRAVITINDGSDMISSCHQSMSDTVEKRYV